MVPAGHEVLGQRRVDRTVVAHAPMQFEVERNDQCAGPGVLWPRTRGYQLAHLTPEPTASGAGERREAKAPTAAGPDAPLRVEPSALDRVLAVMRCPRCGSPVGRVAAARSLLVGPHPPRDAGLPRRDSVVRSPTTGGRQRARTFESFGYEWTTFSEVMDEDEALLRPLPARPGHVPSARDAGSRRRLRPWPLHAVPRAAPRLPWSALDGSDAVQ